MGSGNSGSKGSWPALFTLAGCVSLNKSLNRCTGRALAAGIHCTDSHGSRPRGTLDRRMSTSSQGQPRPEPSPAQWGPAPAPTHPRICPSESRAEGFLSPSWTQAQDWVGSALQAPALISALSQAPGPRAAMSMASHVLKATTECRAASTEESNHEASLGSSRHHSATSGIHPSRPQPHRLP